MDLQWIRCQRERLWVACAVALCTASFGLSACSSETEEPKAAEGEACTVTADCQTGLACREGLCVASATTNNVMTGDMGDMSSDMPAENNNSMSYTDEDYYISYILDTDDKETLQLLDTSTGESVQLNPDEIDCQVGCWASSDLSVFLYARPSTAGPAGSFEILTAPLDASFQAGTPTTLVDGVRDMRVVDNLLSYIREDGEGQPDAYYQPLSGGAETKVGFLGTDPRNEDTWAINPRGGDKGIGVVYQRTLNTLDILIGEMGAEITEKYFTIDGRNYQNVGGSFFGGTIPTATTNDGRVVAFAVNGPNNYRTCTPQNEAEVCTGPGQKCGVMGFCTAIELTVHFVDRDNLSTLNTKCEGDDQCGGIHTCYVPSPTMADKAVCIPRRVVIGLPLSPNQGTPARDGCQNTASDMNDPFHYTTISSNIMFDANDDLFLTAQRECSGDSELNYPDSDVLKLSPFESSYEVAYGNPGVDYADINCYDTSEREFDVNKPDCRVYIRSALLSPGGNEFAFIGTNPSVADPALATKRLDVWSVLRDVSKQEWLGRHPDAGTTVRQLMVHPK